MCDTQHPAGHPATQPVQLGAKTLTVPRLAHFPMRCCQACRSPGVAGGGEHTGSRARRHPHGSHSLFTTRRGSPNSNRVRYRLTADGPDNFDTQTGSRTQTHAIACPAQRCICGAPLGPASNQAAACLPPPPMQRAGSPLVSGVPCCMFQQQDTDGASRRSMHGWH